MSYVKSQFGVGAATGGLVDRFKWLDSPWRPVWLFFFQALIALAICRTGLMLWKWERVGSLIDGLRILVYGFRMDTIILCYLLAVPTLVAPVLNGFRYTHRLWRLFSVVWFSVSFFFLAFMESATPFFIQEYDTRPNRLFVEYLEYPKEVATMLLAGYKLELLFGAVAIGGILYFVRHTYPKMVAHPSSWGLLPRLVCLPLMAFLIFAGARSTTGRRPANPSNVAFSTDQLMNNLPLSSAYTLFYAIYRMKDEADASKVYGEVPIERMLALVKANSTGDASLYQNPDIPTLRNFTPQFKRDRPLNLVIVLEESLGAEFVGRMGGLPLTPNLDALSEEGLFFERLYATGTRSVRGIEAVLTGFFPTPARSIVKLGKSQSGFFTLASFLKSKGYKTRFVYGGAGNFDNMKSFFLGNGFDEVVEESDYDTYTFKGSWGVCDEDLFTKTDALLDADGDVPTFTLVFSSSNHSPFEFPDGTIELYEEPKATVNNAVKYADYAIGRFFEMAKKSAYWDKTLFLVVADHNSRVYGDALVPIERFNIPALIIGPGVVPAVNTSLASQVDLPPTLLSIMGVEGETPMLGRDLMNVPEGVAGRAIMQFYKNLAYMEGENVVVLQPGGVDLQFRYDGQSLLGAPLDSALAEKARAHAQWASWSYKNRLYRLP